MKKCISKIKNVSLVISIITIFSILLFSTTSAFAAENYNGGWAITTKEQEVFYESSCKTHKGTVYYYEGVTVLNTSGNVAEIQYTTSNGPKTGFVPISSLDTSLLSKTCVARVNTSASLYYGNSTSYGRSGSVSAGELVAVLAKNDDWVYVEYNTNSGRKRGYMLYSQITCYNRPSVFPDFYMYNNPGRGKQYYAAGTEILAGPSYQYVTTDTLPQRMYLTYYESILWSGLNGVEYEFVEYTVDGVKKSGFIESQYY